MEDITKDIIESLSPELQAVIAKQNLKKLSYKDPDFTIRAHRDQSHNRNFILTDTPFIEEAHELKQIIDEFYQLGFELQTIEFKFTQKENQLCSHSSLWSQEPRPSFGRFSGPLPSSGRPQPML